MRLDIMTRNPETNGINLAQDDVEFVEEIHADVKGPLAILWDIENCCIPNGVSPEEVGGNIRKSLHMRGIRGPVTTFSAYGDFSDRPRNLRESCQRSGVTLIDVPNGKKDAADKAILVDMFLFALENPPPSTILLISGDVDFALALNKLAQRGYTILVAVTNFSQTCSALCNAAKFVWEWPEMVRSQGFAATPDRIPSKGKEKVLEANGDCELTSETTRGSNLNFLMRPSDLKLSGIDALKDEILSLLHMNRGMIMISQVRACYEKAFNKHFSLKKQGYKLKQLLDELGNDVYVAGQEQRKYLCLRLQWNSDASRQNNMIDASACGLPFDMTTESNLTFSMQPSNIAPGDCGMPVETTTQPNVTSPMEPRNIGPGDFEMTSEITSQLNSSSLMHPGNIRLDDCGLPSETTEANPTSLRHPSIIGAGDYEILFETEEANRTSLMQPNNISSSDCVLPFETTKTNPASLMPPETTETNPTSLRLPSNINPGDFGLPSEITEPNTTSLMQPINISRGDCRLPSETTGKTNPTCMMHPRNIRPNNCGMPSEKTKSNQTFLMKPSKIRWGQGKYLFSGSQNNSNAFKQNNIKGLQARKTFKEKMKMHEGFRVKGSKPIKINQFKGSCSKQAQLNRLGRLLLRIQNEGMRTPNHQQKKNGRDGKNVTLQSKNFNGMPSQGSNENLEITSRKGSLQGCFICGGSHYAKFCLECEGNGREITKHEIHVALDNQQVDHHATSIQIKGAGDNGLPFETLKEKQSRGPKEGCYKCGGEHYCRICPELDRDGGEKANHHIHVALDNQQADRHAAPMDIKDGFPFETIKENRSRGPKGGCYNCGGEHYAINCPECKRNGGERENHQIHVALDNHHANNHATSIERNVEGDNGLPFQTKKENQSRGPKGGCYKCGGEHYVNNCPELKRNGGERENHQIHVALDNRHADNHATSIEIKVEGDNGLPFQTKKENQSRGPKEGCYKRGGDHRLERCCKRKRNCGERDNHQIHDPTSRSPDRSYRDLRIPMGIGTIPTALYQPCPAMSQHYNASGTSVSSCLSWGLFPI